MFWCRQVAWAGERYEGVVKYIRVAQLENCSKVCDIRRHKLLFCHKMSF